MLRYPLAHVPEAALRPLRRAARALEVQRRWRSLSCPSSGSRAPGCSLDLWRRPPRRAPRCRLAPRLAPQSQDRVHGAGADLEVPPRSSDVGFVHERAASSAAACHQCRVLSAGADRVATAARRRTPTAARMRPAAGVQSVAVKRRDSVAGRPRSPASLTRARWRSAPLTVDRSSIWSSSAEQPSAAAYGRHRSTRASTSVRTGTSRRLAGSITRASSPSRAARKRFSARTSGAVARLGGPSSSTSAAID